MPQTIDQHIAQKPLKRNELQVIERVITNSEADLSMLYPLKKREAYERLITDFWSAGNTLIAQGWLYLLGPIRDEGLWRTATDENGQPYREFAVYARDFASRTLKRVSERTTYGYIGKLDALKELGIGADDAVRTIVEMPSVVDKALALAEFAPDGSFEGLNKSTRARIETHLGIDEAGSAQMTDLQVLADFIPKLAELPKSDASRVVDQISGEWKVMIRYDAQHNEITLVAYQRGRGNKPVEVRFKGSKDSPLPKPIREWLMSKT